MIPCKAGTEHYIVALTIWREARGEPDEAQAAVAWTVLNRVARPGWWGKSIAEVCTKKWQYSSLTDPHDPQLVKWPLDSDPSWQAAWMIAGEVLAGMFPCPVPGADSYFDPSIAPPAWTNGATFCGKIGRLSFYDVDHDHEASTLVAAVAPPDPALVASLKAWLGNG